MTAATRATLWRWGVAFYFASVVTTATLDWLGAW